MSVRAGDGYPQPVFQQHPAGVHCRDARHLPGAPPRIFLRFSPTRWPAFSSLVSRLNPFDRTGSVLLAVAPDLRSCPPIGPLCTRCAPPPLTRTTVFSTPAAHGCLSAVSARNALRRGLRPPHGSRHRLPGPGGGALHATQPPTRRATRRTRPPDRLTPTHATSPPRKKVDEGTYAVLGAASFLAGATRMTVSVCVILLARPPDTADGPPAPDTRSINPCSNAWPCSNAKPHAQELTNNLTLLPLVMLVLLTAKFTGDMFNKARDMIGYDEMRCLIRPARAPRAERRWS